MVPLRTLTKQQRKKLLKASLLKPTNMLVLATGMLAGMFSGMLIPIGIAAYGVLCYLDLSSDGFWTQVLKSDTLPSNTASSPSSLPLSLPVDISRKLETKELRELHDDILSTFQKIIQLYGAIDDFTRKIWGDISPIQELVERSKQLLQKAQNIRDYLRSERIEHIQQGIVTLQEKVDRAAGDPFSQEQYQQALDARKRHLANLNDIQRSYERLVSQLTNISISLDSLHSRMMKLSATGHSPTTSESEHVIDQLHNMLDDMELLDAALDEQFSFPPQKIQAP